MREKEEKKRRKRYKRKFGSGCEEREKKKRRTRKRKKGRKERRTPKVEESLRKSQTNDRTNTKVDGQREKEWKPSKNRKDNAEKGGTPIDGKIDETLQVPEGGRKVNELQTSGKTGEQ